MPFHFVHWRAASLSPSSPFPPKGPSNARSDSLGDGIRLENSFRSLRWSHIRQNIAGVCRAATAYTVETLHGLDRERSDTGASREAEDRQVCVCVEGMGRRVLCCAVQQAVSTHVLTISSASIYGTGPAAIFRSGVFEDTVCS